MYRLRKYLPIFLFLALTACTSETAQPPTPPQNNPKKSEVKTTAPAATPMPFQEMTIPYLRNREYTSTLSSLQKYSDHSSYTSYLTSYTSDGLTINALLTQPKGDKPTSGWPAVVFVHGYIPPNQYKTTEKYVDYINYLASNGFVILKIDLRGHGNSEGEPGGGYYSPDYVIDTINAVAALRSSNFVDTKKIGLWGHSMAGNVTLRAFVAQQDLPALVVWAGAGFTYQDLREYRISDNSYRPLPSSNQSQQKRQRLFDTYGNFDPANEFWKQVTPINYLDGISGAIQLHHAFDDNVVNIKYSQNLNTILDKTTIEHQLYTYPTGGHNINGSSFSSAIQRTVEFYKKQFNN